jgi:Lon protease-like protein
MKLPREVPVMTLPNATLFPQALQPLYIFEPRYRKMLADALRSNRMFAVAMQKPGNTRERPSPIAGLGLIRVAVKHADETSHLILQGLARVELGETIRYKPYRIQRVRPLRTPPCDTVAADALLAKVRELLQERINLGLPFPPFPTASASVSGKEVLKCLDAIESPEQAVDLVSWQVLLEASERQVILETIDVEARLRRLIQFLLAEIRQRQKGDKHE